MANFFWLPYYDKTWDTYLNLRTGVNPSAKILPYSNGGHGYSGFTNGNWAALAAGDHLQIATHGRKYSTQNVAWACPAGMITWTPQQMANVLQGFVGAKSINYELLACFGANSWGFASSFAEKLAGEMTKAGLKGTLSALRGATNIGLGQGRQTGDSRFTTGLKMFRIQMPAALGGRVLKEGGTDPNGAKTADSVVTWDL